jgi:putative sterol carrier protein
MASLEQSREAVASLVGLLMELEEQKRRKIPDRSLSLVLPDLPRTFHARLESGALVDVSDEDEDVSDSDVALEMSSDHLLALVNGELSFPIAWATRKIKVRASVRDLLELPRWF